MCIKVRTSVHVDTYTHISTYKGLFIKLFILYLTRNNNNKLWDTSVTWYYLYVFTYFYIKV